MVLISGSAALDPKPAFAAVATINAAIIALAKAFAELGTKDGVQVNSVVPGAIMTGRRRSFLEHWAPEHGTSLDEATKQFPEKAGIPATGNRRRLPACWHTWFPRRLVGSRAPPFGWMAPKSKVSRM